MILKPKHFSLEELACPHIYDKYGELAWGFFDPRLLIILDVIRDALNKPIYINDWQIHGSSSQSGFRCIQCGIVKKAIADKVLYVSAHMEGQAVDCHVQGMTAEEVRQWLVQNESILPYPIRLESDVNWVHCDVRGGDNKITFFKG
jgi:hypothetical protein